MLGWLTRFFFSWVLLGPPVSTRSTFTNQSKLTRKMRNKNKKKRRSLARNGQNGRHPRPVRRKNKRRAEECLFLSRSFQAFLAINCRFPVVSKKKTVGQVSVRFSIPSFSNDLSSETLKTDARKKENLCSMFTFQFETTAIVPDRVLCHRFVGVCFFFHVLKGISLDSTVPSSRMLRERQRQQQQKKTKTKMPRMERRVLIAEAT